MGLHRAPFSGANAFQYVAVVLGIVCSVCRFVTNSHVAPLSCQHPLQHNVSPRLFSPIKRSPSENLIVLGMRRSFSLISPIAHSSILCCLIIALGILRTELTTVARHSISKPLRFPAWSYSDTEQMLRDARKPMTNAVVGSTLKPNVGVKLRTAKDHDE